MTIDWKFITGLEACALKGYVPKAGDSGVTIATGVDLGYRSETDVHPLAFAARLRPYLGLKGDAARQALAGTPLTVSQGEADAIDGRAREVVLGPLEAHFKAASGVDFGTVLAAAQTVVASVTWQYGTPWVRCPKFWGLATARDWLGVVGELRNFGDDYPTRRHREADYLEGALRDHRA